jgi:von Willebrand factor type A domain
MAGILTTGTGGPTGAGTSTGTGGGDACSTQASDSNSIPSDIFIMLDKSGSMNCPAADSACEMPPNPIVHPTRWEAFTQAVNGFVNSPQAAGIGVGIGYFSQGTNNAACNVGTYATPTVPIAALPGNAGAITNAIGGLMPGGNTPTVPALQGALQYATAYTNMTPGRAASVVFITDGLPNGCNSTINAAAMAAQQAFQGMPSIKTYVVGLGATAALDQIALAGTGNATHYFPATGDVAAQLTAALTTISGAVTCDYVIPTNGQVDPLNVNISVSVGGGGSQVVGYVGSAAMCGAMGGWYYDNPTKPTKVTLCPQTCDPLKATPNSKVQVLYGCPRVGPGVN